MYHHTKATNRYTYKHTYNQKLGFKHRHVFFYIFFWNFKGNHSFYDNLCLLFILLIMCYNDLYCSSKNISQHICLVNKKFRSKLLISKFMLKSFYYDANGMQFLLFDFLLLCFTNGAYLHFPSSNFIHG